MALQSTASAGDPLTLLEIYNYAVANGYTGAADLNALIAWSGWANLPGGANDVLDFLGAEVGNLIGRVTVVNNSGSTITISSPGGLGFFGLDVNPIGKRDVGIGETINSGSQKVFTIGSFYENFDSSRVHFEARINSDISGTIQITAKNDSSPYTILMSSRVMAKSSSSGTYLFTSYYDDPGEYDKTGIVDEIDLSATITFS